MSLNYQPMSLTEQALLQKAYAALEEQSARLERSGEETAAAVRKAREPTAGGAA